MGRLRRLINEKISVFDISNSRCIGSSDLRRYRQIPDKLLELLTIEKMLVIDKSVDRTHLHFLLFGNRLVDIKLPFFQIPYQLDILRVDAHNKIRP